MLARSDFAESVGDLAFLGARRACMRAARPDPIARSTAAESNRMTLHEWTVIVRSRSVMHGLFTKEGPPGGTPKVPRQKC